MLSTHQHSQLWEIHCFGIGEAADKAIREKKIREIVEKEKAEKNKDKADNKTDDKAEDGDDKSEP